MATLNEARDVRSAARRALQFASIDDLSRDLDVIEAAHRAGTLSHTGNHPPGAILQHLAAAINGSFDGIPDLGGPIWLRVLGPFVKRVALSRPLTPGVRLKRHVDAKVWDDRAEFEPSLMSLRGAIQRLKTARVGPTERHPFFGRLTRDEWIRFHLLHAQMHLSFVQV